MTVTASRARLGAAGRTGPAVLRAVSAGRAVAVGWWPLTDLLALAVAVVLAGMTGWRAVGYLTTALVALAASGLHRMRICPRVADQVPRLVACTGLAVFPVLPFSTAGAALSLALWASGVLVAFRITGVVVLRVVRARGWVVDPTLLVGMDETGAKLVELSIAHPELGLRITGFLDGHSPAEAAELVRRVAIRRVIVGPGATSDERLTALLHVVRALRVDVCVVPRLPGLGLAVPLSCVDDVRGIPLLPLRSGGFSWLGRLVKRAFDLVVGGLLAVLLAPVIAVLAGLVRLRCGGPVLFRQVRVTGPRRLARIVKLRTLPTHADADTRWAVPLAAAGPVGRWLRTTHLDELPQLANVLHGEMSLVGPRPERPHFARRFAGEIPGYPNRHRMPAGITGWAQVHGLHGNSSIADRVRFDNQYIEYWSPWLDLVILIRTLGAAVRRPGEWG